MIITKVRMVVTPERGRGCDWKDIWFSGGASQDLVT